MATQTSETALDTDFIYTPSQDWFSPHIPSWTAFFPLVVASEAQAGPRILEIGSWEGRSAVFLLQNLCQNGGSITCIDHFDLEQTDAGIERLRKVKHNLNLTGKPFRLMPEFSTPALMKLLVEEMTNPNPGFDWLYIDGSHEADDTFLDGELCWRLARKGAVVIFDDYRWNQEPEDSCHHPKRGIDAFLELHKGEYERLSGENPDEYQVVLRKTTDMRIGFLVPEAVRGQQVQQKLDADAFGYGINVAFAIDHTFEMPLAVAIRSLVEHTPGRISIYIANAGLETLNEDMIRNSVVQRTDVTITFLSLPADKSCLAREFASPTWAKLDMIAALPVERVLYLDADILVRTSVKALWDTNLKDVPLAAAVDVGYPMGHSDIERDPYFNAGVLLMDLAKIRLELPQVLQAARAKVDSPHKDQDALNVHFARRWLQLDLCWNAQGLGTYAKHPSSDRKSLDMSGLKDPAIVHFTGPVHPKMEEVLNPHVQPATAKPWGYAGAPGHPFEEAWWNVAKMTCFGEESLMNALRESNEVTKVRAVTDAKERLSIVLQAAKNKK